MSRVVVSIICNAYNHEAYIRDALNGFLMQKTNFEFEVLVHDDASTDKTADIIREYEKEYPEIIKPIYQTENQYSKGKGIVGKIQRARVTGKYTAICEGDDYWTDKYKLQKQYDAMELYSDVDICAHAASGVDAATGKIIKVIAPAKKDTIFKVEDVIIGGGGYVATNSLFYRSDIDKNIPQFRQMLGLDLTLQIHGSLRGGMLFLSNNMSVYRMCAKGSWTERMSGDHEKQVLHAKRVLAMFDVLNRETNYRYANTINKKCILNEIAIFERQGDHKKILSKPYIGIYKDLPFKRKVKIFLKACIQFLSVWKKQ